ncbi:hypothetical protein [Allokutzneria sp. NRRL B-24872]|uniref:hypothetical protein n=1 Tax=Allokutzneria sp. NRRL B-24872 TaxID=1137961 RepID=UPI000A3A5FD3|nr:hypothetical protein [Allokutzneria sp. NRRL B-24872]
MRNRAMKLAVAVSAFAVALAGPAAAAETEESAPQSALGEGSGTFEVIATPAPGAPGALAVIRCVGGTDNPHKSHTDPRRANVHVNITCSANVARIAVRGAIYRDGALAGTSARNHVTTGKRSAANHANTACRNNHLYESWVGGEIKFPPNYVPPTGRISAFGRSARITNC